MDVPCDGDPVARPAPDRLDGIRFEGDLDMASATQDEYDHILRETNWVIPEAHGQRYVAHVHGGASLALRRGRRG